MDLTDRRSMRSKSHMLDAISQVRPEPGQRRTADSITYLQPSKEGMVIQCVGGGGKVKQGKDSYVSRINRQQDVRQDPKYSSFRGMPRSISRLQFGQQVMLFHVCNELQCDELLQRLRHDG